MSKNENMTIKDIKDILEVHDLTKGIHGKKSAFIVTVNALQMAQYMYAIGYRKPKKQRTPK